MQASDGSDNTTKLAHNTAIAHLVLQLIPGSISPPLDLPARHECALAALAEQSLLRLEGAHQTRLDRIAGLGHE